MQWLRRKPDPRVTETVVSPSPINLSCRAHCVGTGSPAPSTALNRSSFIFTIHCASYIVQGALSPETGIPDPVSGRFLLPRRRLTRYFGCSGPLLVTHDVSQKRNKILRVPVRHLVGRCRGTAAPHAPRKLRLIFQ